MGSVATRNTGEGGLVRSVLIIDRSTRGAPFTGVFGVDEQHTDAGRSGLVRDECLQLSERPVTKPSALGTAGLGPFANAPEVFKADAAAGALRLQHDGLRDAVVFVPLEPPLFSRQLARFAFGGLGAATLQSGSAPRHPAAYLLDPLARVVPAITIGCQVDDTEVDAKELGRLDLVGVDDLADAGKIPVTADQHQVDFALAVGEPIALALAHDRLDLEASFEGPDRHDGFGFEADNSVVVRLGRVFIEPALRVLGTGFVGVGDIGDAPNCDLGCEFKVLPQIPTARLVQVELPNGRGPAWPANYKPHSPARGCGAGRLLPRGEIDVGDQLHGPEAFFKCEEKQGADFLCRLGLKATVSSGGFL
jgi:hypothetical protein